MGRRVRRARVGWMTEAEERDGDCDGSHHGTERERCGCPRSTHGLQHVRHVRDPLPDRSDGRGRSRGLGAGQCARHGHRRQPLRQGFGRTGFRVRRRPATADATDPHGPAWRRPVAAGILGRGPRLHRRQAARDDRGLRRARHRALRSRRPFQRPDADLRAGARLAELLRPRRRLRRQHPQRCALALRRRCHGAPLRPEEHQAPRALRPQYGRVAHGQRGQGLHGRAGERDALHLHRPARQHHGLQGHQLLAGATEQRLRA